MGLRIIAFGLGLTLLVMPGCGGGIGDDPHSPLPTGNRTANTVGLNAQVTIPSTDVALSIQRAAVNWKAVSLTIGGLAVPVAGNPIQTGADTVLGFGLTGVEVSQIQRDSNGFAKLRVFISGTEVANANILISSELSEDSPATTAVTSLRFTLRANVGNYLVENLTYTPPTSSAAVTATATPTTSGSLLLAEGIEYYRNGAWYFLDAATDVPAANTQIRIRFNLEVENPLTAFTFSAQGKASTVILNQTSIGSDLSASFGSDNKTLTFTLIGSNAGRLSPGNTYSVTFQSSSMHLKGNPAVTLSTPVGTQVSFKVL